MIFTFLCLCTATYGLPGSSKYFSVALTPANSTNRPPNLFYDPIPLWPLDNCYYKMKLRIGTPPVTQEFVVDTTISDLWVNSQPGNGDYFEYKSSTTFRNNVTSQIFAIPAVLNPKVLGFWGADRVSVFGSTFETVIGVAAYSTLPQRLGLGPAAGESFTEGMTSRGHLYPMYPNFIEILKARGLISEAAFSLWLGAAPYGAGSLVFGGVDPTRYTGSLSLVPMVDAHSIKYRVSAKSLSIVLTRISGRAQARASFNMPVKKPVLFDSTGFLSYLPTSVVTRIGTAFGLEYNENLQMYLIDCNLDGAFKLNFSGATINLSLQDMMIHSESENLSDDEKCVLAINGRTTEPYVLGVAALKRIYAVFDLDRNEAAIAQAVTVNPGRLSHYGKPTRWTNSPILEIISTIPNATPAKQNSRTLQTVPVSFDK